MLGRVQVQAFDSVVLAIGTCLRYPVQLETIDVQHRSLSFTTATAIDGGGLLFEGFRLCSADLLLVFVLYCGKSVSDL